MRMSGFRMAMCLKIRAEETRRESAVVGIVSWYEWYALTIFNILIFITINYHSLLQRVFFFLIVFLFIWSSSTSFSIILFRLYTWCIVFYISFLAVPFTTTRKWFMFKYCLQISILQLSNANFVGSSSTSNSCLFPCYNLDYYISPNIFTRDTVFFFWFYHYFILVFIYWCLYHQAVIDGSNRISVVTLMLNNYNTDISNTDIIVGII